MEEQKTYYLLRGFMRSGTNWIGNLLNLHPDICCTGEYHLHRLHAGFEKISTPGQDPATILMSEAINSEVIEAYETFVKKLIDIGSRNPDKPTARILGDRTPCPMNAVILRDAKRIHVVRDGRDCLVSLTFHFLRMGNTDYPFENLPAMKSKRKRFQNHQEYFRRNPHELLDHERWVRQRARRWGQRFLRDSRFIKKHSEAVFQLTYEKLHHETEKFRTLMYQFLGADPSKAAPLNETTSAGFDREDLKSHYRKGSIGDWKRHFHKEARVWFAEEAGDALIAAGYEPNNDWVNVEPEPNP